MKFVTVAVTDQDRALAFYTGKLGFRLATDQPYDGKQRWLELSIPGSEGRIVLWSTENGKAGGWTPITFWSDDVPATIQDLRDKGVEIIMEPTTEHWGTAAAFKDPDGNCFVVSSK